MGKTLLAKEILYRDPEQLELLKQLAVSTRITRATLAREAIDELLIKYKRLKPPRKP